MLVAFAKARLPLYGAAFDIIQLAAPIDLSDPNDIHANLQHIRIGEVKSTNRSAIGDDFAGYFFNITAGELLTAQALGAKYQFLFVNTVTRFHIERSLQEVFAAARGMYPAWHIRF